MADPRFFDRLGPLTLNEIAALSGAAISDSASGNDTVDTVAPISEARPGALCYLENAKLLRAYPDIRLDGVILLAPPALAEDLAGRGAHVLTHAQPRAGFGRAAAALYRLKPFAVDSAIAPDADIAGSSVIGHGVVIGAGARIGENVVIGPGSAIGPGCRIGAGTHIGPRAVILCADLGENCNILSGAVIGETGFGAAISDDGLVDMPHLGVVEIASSVTIGANSCVDRGQFGATVIGEGTKIDNLCHIGHNCRVGRNVAMAAFAGVSGSCVIEDDVMFGGRVGLQDHITIGKGARIGGNSALAESVPAGETWMGDPAQPLRQYLRQVSEVRRLAKRGGERKTKKKD